MRKYLLILIFGLFFSEEAFPCVCAETSQDLINGMCEYYEVIFTGTVIEGDNWNRFTVEQWNNEQRGFDVLIRVDSVIKGDIIIGETLFIYQVSGGSCTESFEYNSKKLVFGRVMKKLNYKSRNSNPNDMNIQPSPLGLKKDGSYDLYENDEVSEFLRCKLEQYSVIDTNMCSTFNYQSKLYKKAISFLSY